MNYYHLISMFGIMLMAALIPSISNAAIVTRAAAFGFSHGLVTCFGIAVVDIIYVFIALFGLSFVAESGYFFYIKLLGAAYLIFLGIQLFRVQNKAIDSAKPQGARLFNSFITGFSITLADQKAILFYFGFFPAFIDMSSLSIGQVGMILGLVVLAISSKLIYALLGESAAQHIQNSPMATKLQKLLALLLVAIGILLVFK